MANNLSSHEAKLYSPLSLAFLGDSVYELWIRNHLVLKANMQAKKFNLCKVKYVCAEYQATACEKILSVLTETEVSVFKRGRNAKGISVPKHATESEYRKATGLEAVLGYLYLLGDENRIDFLMNIIFEE